MVSTHSYDNVLLRMTVVQFLEFLEVSIHSILHIREIYPQTLFDKVRKYRVPAWMSTIQELNAYIRKTLEGVAPWFQKGTMERFAIGLFDKRGKLVERFVFEVSNLKGNRVPQSVEARDAEAVWLRENFRAFLTRLQLTDALLGDSPELMTFKLFAYARESSSTFSDREDATPRERWKCVSSEIGSIGEAKITPIRSAVYQAKGKSESGIRMQLFVEKKCG